MKSKKSIVVCALSLGLCGLGYAAEQKRENGSKEVLITLSEKEQNEISAKDEDSRKQALKQFDKDGDGKLNADEQKAQEKAAAAESLELLFKELDRDGDQKISLDELKQMVGSAEVATKVIRNGKIIEDTTTQHQANEKCGKHDQVFTTTISGSNEADLEEKVAKKVKELMKESRAENKNDSSAAPEVKKAVTE